MEEIITMISIKQNKLEANKKHKISEFVKKKPKAH